MNNSDMDDRARSTAADQVESGREERIRRQRQREVSKPVGSLFAKRSRRMNQELLAAVMRADNRKTYIVALDECFNNYHPSLLSELDYHIYFLAPHEDRGKDIAARLSKLSDRLFELTLPRRLSGDAFESVWSSATEFAELDSGQVESAVRSLTMRDSHGMSGPTLYEFDGGASFEQTKAIARANINNILFWALDRPSSRSNAKAFLTEWLARTSTPWPRPRDDFTDWLKQIMNIALSSQFSILLDYCALVNNTLATEDNRTELFVGGYASEQSICASCSMRFGSWCPTLIDDRSEALTAGIPEGEPWYLFWPPRLNWATCPYCAHATYINPPTLFYSFNRNQFVYLVPGYSDDDPIDSLPKVLLQFVQSLHEKYIQLRPEAAAVSIKATELVVGAWDSFVRAIWMGETIFENHAWNSVQNPSGGVTILDGTKGFIWELSSEETQAVSWMKSFGF
jgi:hypothetical protein